MSAFLAPAVEAQPTTAKLRLIGVFVGNGNTPAPEVLRVIKSLRLAPMPGLRSAQVYFEMGMINVDVYLDVFDRSTGEPKAIVVSRDMTRAAAECPDSLPCLIREQIKAAFAHEVDECLRGEDGRVLFDPHGDGE